MDNRHLQIDELIRKELANIFLKEVDFPKGCLVTITRVKTSKDIKDARVFISVLPGMFIGKVLSLIRNRSRHFVYLLKKRLSIKYVPDLHFVIEENSGTSEETVFFED